MGTDAVVEKSMTVFPKHNGKPFIYDYWIKGFFKYACGILARVDGTKSQNLKAYKKIINGTVFVQPRMLILDGKLGETCQRPLRAQTAQGERIALANSETVPAGTSFNCTIVLLDEKLEKHVREWLDYGQWSGLGQWRNSGKGRFSWKETK